MAEISKNAFEWKLRDREGNLLTKSVRSSERQAKVKKKYEEFVKDEEVIEEEVEIASDIVLESADHSSTKIFLLLLTMVVSAGL